MCQQCIDAMDVATKGAEAGEYAVATEAVEKVKYAAEYDHTRNALLHDEKLYHASRKVRDVAFSLRDLLLQKEEDLQAEIAMLKSLLNEVECLTLV